MNKQIFGLASSIVLALGVLACSSDETGSTTGSGGSGGSGGSSTTTGTGTTAMPPEASCAKPGDAGNDKGVGQFCTPQGGECTSEYASACLADFGQDQWMCTHIGCKDDTECGADAYCHKENAGSACVPNKCGGAPMGTGGGGGAGGDG